MHLSIEEISSSEERDGLVPDGSSKRTTSYSDRAANCSESPRASIQSVCSTGYFVLRQCRVDRRLLLPSPVILAADARQKGASYPAVDRREVERSYSGPPLSEQQRIVSGISISFRARHPKPTPRTPKRSCPSKATSNPSSQSAERW
jgi:hypothetical protein